MVLLVTNAGIIATGLLLEFPGIDLITVVNSGKTIGTAAQNLNT